MTSRKLVAAALLLLLLAAGIFAARRHFRAPAPVAVVLSGDGSARIASIVRKLSTLLNKETGRPLAVGDLKDLLQAEPSPTAQRFAEAFQSDPTLRRAWKKHSDDEDAKALIRDVVETPAFTNLLARWSSDPTFLALAERSMNGLSEIAADRDADTDRLLIPPVRGAGPVAARRGARAGPGALSRGPGAARAMGASRFEGVGARGGGTTGAWHEGGDRNRYSAEDAHNVEGLKTVGSAGPDMDAARFIASAFSLLTKHERDKLVDLCLTKSICDPWDACALAGLTLRCQEACRRNPSCQPGGGGGGGGGGGQGKGGGDDDDGPAPPPP